MKLGILVTVFGIGMLAFADPTITDVTARQRYPWNGKVDISYTASGIEAAAKQKGWITSLKVTAKDQDTDTTYTATSLSGDTSLADGTHTLVWNMAAQGLAFKSTNVTFDVTCVTKDALYCVIDLSSGSSATSYPVSYISEIPGGSWSDEYKTTKLVLRRCTAGNDPCNRYSLTKDFFMGVFEITQKQWYLVMGTSPSYTTYCKDDFPVNCISIVDIRGTRYPYSEPITKTSFVGKLISKTTLSGGNLPTAAQWEYACRAETTSTYNLGDDETSLSSAGWYEANSGGILHSVGKKTPNNWGLYDMHGNIYEFCLDSDGRDSTYMKGEDPISTQASLWDCYRGGSYDAPHYFCASSAGMCADRGCVKYDVGFRLVLNIQ